MSAIDLQIRRGSSGAYSLTMGVYGRRSRISSTLVFRTIPHCRAMEIAVMGKSLPPSVFGINNPHPVTIKNLIPAVRQIRTTSGMSSLGGSYNFRIHLRADFTTIPTSPIHVRPFSTIRMTEFPKSAWSNPIPSGISLRPDLMIFRARRRTR